MMRGGRAMQRVMSVIVLGTIAPVCLMLTGWWGSFGMLGDGPLIPWAAFGGLALGIALDATVLRRRLGSLFSLPSAGLAAIAAFYSVMIYGFFMGFPVPLLLVPLAWGYVAGRRPGVSMEESRGRVGVASRGSALIMLGACIATAGLAFNEPTIASQVRGMLGLAFTPSIAVLGAGSLVGGALLVAAAWALPVMLGRSLARGDRGEGATTTPR